MSPEPRGAAGGGPGRVHLPSPTELKMKFVLSRTERRSTSNTARFRPGAVCFSVAHTSPDRPGRPGTRPLCLRGPKGVSFHPTPVTPPTPPPGPAVRRHPCPFRISTPSRPLFIMKVFKRPTFQTEIQIKWSHGRPGSRHADSAMRGGGGGRRPLPTRSSGDRGTGRRLPPQAGTPHALARRSLMSPFTNVLCPPPDGAAV